MNKESVQAYWFHLNDRDRLVLSIGGVVVLLYFLYALIYSPLTAAVDVKSQQWIEKKETLAWMKRQAKTPLPSKQTDENLLSVFSNQLKNASFSQYPYQLQQAGESNIRLAFDNVPYLEMITWLQTLNKQYTMTIDEWVVERSNTPGVVKMRLVVGNEGVGK